MDVACHIVRAIPAPAEQPIHLSPAAELAERVLLPGDPQRALAIAQAHLVEPRMFNTRRGLWGYTGRTAGGMEVTVQATGMGGPSAAIVAEELIDLGATTLVRVGTCGSIEPRLGLGELVVVAEALAADGTSRALGADGRVRADPLLTAALARAADLSPAIVASTDLFYDPRAGLEKEWRAGGAVAVEMEAAAVLAVAGRRDVRAGCLLLVSDQLAGGDRTRLAQEELERGGVRLGEVALGALAEDAAAAA
jgi:DeoD family purine-nucleoside phosphorylase